MKKNLNNSGFVLAETLVVTVFLAIIFTMIYQNFYPLIGEYEKRENYNDVDGTYSIYWLKTLIEDSSYKISDFENQKQNFFDENGYIRFNCSDIKDNSKNGLCKELVKDFEVKGCNENGDYCDIFITKYRIGYSDIETDEGIKNDYKFKKTVKESSLKKFEENCRDGDCLANFCSSFGVSGTDCDKYGKIKVFDSKFKDYVKTLPDYSTESLNESEARVIAAFHHTKDNNDYYSYATIEIDRKLT